MDLTGQPDIFWRREKAPRGAVFVDMADYFAAAKTAMTGAKTSIHLLNWAFEPRTRFKPEAGGSGPADDEIGHFLKRLAAANPALDIRILCWKSALPVAATQGFFPLQDRRWFAGSPVKFVLDGKLPFGACHHQKAMIIDDALAFCGGGDIGPDRWDTPEHLDDDPRRLKDARKARFYNSRHEVMTLFDGPPAVALGELFRRRWTRATGETAPGPSPSSQPAWPVPSAPAWSGIDIGISRTQAAWRGEPEIRETRNLTMASIRAAKRCIYMENQYFTAPAVAAVLAKRLAEPDGPEIVLISTQRSPSWFDHMTMDRTRSTFIKHLRAADRYGRFRIYSPVTALGRIIIVHAKVAIIDEDFVRIGSANMNNRSTGFDTECDITFDAAGSEANRAGVVSLRERLVAHWLGCDRDRVSETMASAGTLGRAIEALRATGHNRLRPIEPVRLGPLATPIAALHIGDPLSPADSFRPWLRRARLRAEVEAARAE